MMTAEQAQAIRDIFAETLEQEVPKTARVLAAIPNGNREYQPDPKSRSAWDLATHLATADLWFLNGIVRGVFAEPEARALPAEITTPAGLAAWYSEQLGASVAWLRALSAHDLLRPVSFFRGTKAAVAWLPLLNNHSIHHRGQLAAYLRPSGGKVPALFGVSADEDPSAEEAGSSIPA